MAKAQKVSKSTLLGAGVSEEDLPQLNGAPLTIARLIAQSACCGDNQRVVALSKDLASVIAKEAAPSKQNEDE